MGEHTQVSDSDREEGRPFIDRWERWADILHSYQAVRKFRPKVEAEIAAAEAAGITLSEEEIDDIIARYAYEPLD